VPPPTRVAGWPPTVEELHGGDAFVFGSRSARLESDFLLAKEFCIIGNIVVAPTTSIDVIATTIMMPLIVSFIFFSQ
jgi:hypothetical protein